LSISCWPSRTISAPLVRRHPFVVSGDEGVVELEIGGGVRAQVPVLVVEERVRPARGGDQGDSAVLPAQGAGDAGAELHAPGRRRADRVELLGLDLGEPGEAAAAGDGVLAVAVDGDRQDRQVDDMRRHTDDAAAYMRATVDFHTAIAHAAGPTVIVGLYETVLALLRAGVVRAAFVEPREELVAHAVGVHEGMVAAVRDRDADAMAKLLTLHGADLERVPDDG
jgi:FCD domain-containing protein